MTGAGASTRFVLLSSQRSGSTWLLSILNQVEATAAFGELFLYRRRTPEQSGLRFDFDYPRYLESPATGLPLRPFALFAYLDHFYNRRGTVGFKLMYSQWRKYPELLLYFWRRHVRVVHLVRWNHLDVILSRAIKATTDQPHLLSGEMKRDSMLVELDPASLLRRLRTQQRSVAFARRLLHWSRLCHLEVAYEDLVQDPLHFDCLWNFLGINPERQLPQSPFKKIRTRNHGEVIRNYKEVKAVLTGSPFAHLLE